MYLIDDTVASSSDFVSYFDVISMQIVKVSFDSVVSAVLDIDFGSVSFFLLSLQYLCLPFRVSLLSSFLRFLKATVHLL